MIRTWTTRRSALSRRLLTFAAAAATATGLALAAAAVPAQAATGDARMHDPSVIKVGSCYYGFSTGVGGGPGQGSVTIRRSCTAGGGSGWTYVGPVFNSVPQWITNRLGQTPPNLWAPDINYFNGKYHLYYAGSIWGQTKLAVVGLATATNITGPWTDQGQVTDLNYPIDPEVAWSGSTPYLISGGFPELYIRQLNPSTGKLVSNSGTKLAIRVENASIKYNGGYFYMFASKGGCCAGTNSTYYTVISRSRNITGPYTDKSGGSMVNGGGTRILSGSGSQVAAGGGDVFEDGSTTRFAYHFYNANNSGLEQLAIRDIGWSNGWPTFGPAV